MTAMTKGEIEAILDRVRMWPRRRQEDAARILLAMEAQDASVYRLSDEERADIDASLEELARGEIASDEEVRATLSVSPVRVSYSRRTLAQLEDIFAYIAKDNPAAAAALARRIETLAAQPTRKACA